MCSLVLTYVSQEGFEIPQEAEAGEVAGEEETF